MTIKSSPRLWAVVALAGTVAVVALGYVFLISGAKSDRTSYSDQSADVAAQAAVSRNKLRGLAAENRKLPTYRAQLADLAKAVPGAPNTAQFVSDMQVLSQLASVSITAINITPPSASSVSPTATAAANNEQSSAPATTGDTGDTAPAPGASELPITIAVKGSADHLDAFLALLQNVEPRTLLVGQAVESVPDGSSATGGGPTLTVNMKAFFSAS